MLVGLRKALHPVNGVFVRAQHPVKMRTCRFYMGELMMSLLALSAALYGMAAVNRWSFSVFLTLQGELGLLSSLYWAPTS